MQRVMLIGHLGRDPEVRSLNSGDKVANISLATSERWKDKQTGEPRDRTEWHRVVLFGRLAEIAEKYLRKGDQVCFDGGHLQTRKWQDQSGQDKYTTEVVLNQWDGRLKMLGSKSGQAASEPADEQASEPKEEAPKRGPLRGGGDLDDEIPFAPLRELP